MPSAPPQGWRHANHSILAAVLLAALTLFLADSASAAKLASEAGRLPTHATAKQKFLSMSVRARADSTVVAKVRVRRAARVEVRLKATCLGRTQQWRRVIRPGRARVVSLRARCPVSTRGARARPAPGRIIVSASGNPLGAGPNVSVGVGVAPPLPAPQSGSLSWAPPTLSDPMVVNVSERNRSLTLDRQRDYIVRMPSTPLRGMRGLTIDGGRNVVLIGGEIWIPELGDAPAATYGRGLYLSNQTGVVHVEGLRLTGPGLDEGIDLAQPRSKAVQLQNIRVDALHSRDEVNFSQGHPDLLQTWAGPNELRVDGFSGTTDYQGFFLHPTQINNPVPPRLFDFRRVSITGTDTSAYLLWQAVDFPMALRDVHLTPAPGRERMMWPNPSKWAGVRTTPTAEDYVPAGLAGTDYRTPGYR